MMTTNDSDKNGKDDQDMKGEPARQLPRPTLINREPGTYRLNEYGNFLFIQFIPGNLFLPLYGVGALIRMEVKRVLVQAGYTQYELLDSYMGPQIFFRQGISDDDYQLAYRSAGDAVEYMEACLKNTLRAWREGETVQIEFRRDFISMEAEVVRRALIDRGCQHPAELPLSHPVRHWYDGNPSDYIEYVMEEIKSWEEQNK